MIKVKVNQIKESCYVYRYRSISFNGLPTAPSPIRKNGYLDDFDFVFDSKEDYMHWFRKLTISLAELDESMNYCRYFIREKGNVGKYVRDGKSFTVDGSWVGNYDFCWGNPSRGFKPTELFVVWMKDNGWNKNNWFELMDRYKI